MQVYCLQLFQQADSIHNIFNVSLLKPYLSDRQTMPKPSILIEIDGEENRELGEILQSEYRYNN
jgi:hypothetical protein